MGWMERLGRGQQMQYDLNPLPQFDYTIVAVALGQDHTLAVTKAGEVLSWGLNRFAQLGYVVETTSGKFVDEPIQATPKKILNPLRKEVVIGVAACKTASACWTAEEVYTWGTNHGQLGYNKHAHPVQVPPRKVTKFSMPIVAMALTVRPALYVWLNVTQAKSVRITSWLAYYVLNRWNASGVIGITA